MGYEMPRVKDTSDALVWDAPVCVFCALAQGAWWKGSADRVAFPRWNTRGLCALAFARTPQRGWLRFLGAFPCASTFFSEVCARLLLTRLSSPSAPWPIDGENSPILPVSLLPSLTCLLFFSQKSLHVTCLDFYPQFF